MSLRLYAENDSGDMVEVADRLRADTLEVSFKAAEGAVGESQIVIDDPDGTFYIRGHKPLYLVETEAADDPFHGVIGALFAWDRTFRRGPYRTDAGREVVITVKDVNTLATRRVQKGKDARRPQENDTVRVGTWLVGTPEVTGADFPLADTTYLFTDSPVPMSETDYTGQDSAGVLNDALQDSGKNAYLYNAPSVSEPIRVGIWYGLTEREDFASDHRISNDLADIDPDTLSYFTDNPVDLEAGAYTFAPSIDADLNRDPSRVHSGAGVSYDGGYEYVPRASTAAEYADRDLPFQAELVKTAAQARARGNRYNRDDRHEDDAITCAVLVPAALVNGFYQGHRVEVRFSYLPGYTGDFVWMRIAERTVRQISAALGIYEIGLDLRAESPPDVGVDSGGDSGIFCVMNRPASFGGSEANPGGALYWGSTGDNPKAGWAHLPTQGPFTILTDAAHEDTPWPYYAIQVTEPGTIALIEMMAFTTGIIFGSAVHVCTYAILKNGVPIATTTQNLSNAVSGGVSVGLVTVTDVDVDVDDIITAAVTVDPPMAYFRVPSGVGGMDERLLISGGSF